MRRSLTIHQNNKVVNTIIEKEDESETIEQGRIGECCAKFFQEVCEDPSQYIKITKWLIQSLKIEVESETIDQYRTGEWCAKFFQEVCEDPLQYIKIIKWLIQSLKMGTNQKQ